MRKLNYNEKGITLIALVITIIILLILAGVTLTTALSQNGLFERAKYAGEKYKESEADETEKLGEAEKEIDKIVDDKKDEGNDDKDKEKEEESQTKKYKIKVTKKVITQEGELVEIKNARFYVALYSDEDRSNKVSEIKTIDYSGKVPVSVEFTDLEPGIYYVSECDENGNSMDNGTNDEGAVWSAYYEKGNQVTCQDEDYEKELSFENIFAEMPREY